MTSLASSTPRSARFAWILGFVLAAAVMTASQSASAQRGEFPEAEREPAPRRGFHETVRENITDSSPHLRPQLISVLTGFHYGNFSTDGVPFFVGARYYHPILHDGFIPKVNDEFGIEGGADLIFNFLDDFHSDVSGDSIQIALGIPVTALWAFHFTPSFDAYAKAGFTFGFKSKVWDSDNVVWANVVSQVGVRFRLNNALYLRGEVGWPAVAAGLGFAF